MKTLFLILMMSICLTGLASENLYIVCSTTNFDANYKTWSSGGENYSLDGTKVQFSNRFSGQQVRTLVQDPDVDIYNGNEIGAILNTPEWKEVAPLVITIDAQFKSDYSAVIGTANKLDFLETRLGLK